MKIKIKALIVLTTFALLTSCGYQRLGDFTMISNRNISDANEYILLYRNAEGKAKVKDDDALEKAVDAATEEHQGEYLMNVKVFLKKNGKRIKVIGDVYGIRNTNVDVTTSAEKTIRLRIGDLVSFTESGKLIEANIIGLNKDAAIVEYQNWLNKYKQLEVAFDRLTKIEREKGH